MTNLFAGSQVTLIGDCRGRTYIVDTVNSVLSVGGVIFVDSDRKTIRVLVPRCKISTIGLAAFNRAVCIHWWKKQVVKSVDHENRINGNINIIGKLSKARKK